jgi:2-hydroxychromene-2-carboxylate isomerase
MWVSGLNLNDQEVIDKILKNLEINPKTFSLRLSNQNIKDELKKRTQEAYEKGVFGAPTFLANNKIFWGQDRLEYALAESLK